VSDVEHLFLRSGGNEVLREAPARDSPMGTHDAWLDDALQSFVVASAR